MRQTVNLRLKISLGLAFAALASLPLAAESPLTQVVAESQAGQVPDWSLQALRDLSRRGIIDSAIPNDGQGITREQLALISAQAFNAVRREDGSQERIHLAQLPAMPDLPPDLGGSSLPAMGAASGDRETVYKLVQEYHDELVKLGAKGKDLTEQLVALKTSQSDLTKAFDRVLNSTGVKLNGEATVHSVNLLLYPTNYSAKTERIWPTIAYFDLKLSARPRKEIYAEVVYRMEKVFGGFWGALDIAGVRSFYFKADTDIAFELGKVPYKNTPLTLWAQEDSYPYEIDVLARKRRENMEDRQLGDNKWPLHGGRIYGTLVLFDSMELDLSALGTRLAINSTKNSPLDFGVIMPYDQWLVGGTARISGAKDKSFYIGGSYFEINESVDTNASASIFPQQRNTVAGADLSVNLLGEEIVLSGEWAASNYTPIYGASSYTDASGTYYVASWTAGSAGEVQIKVNGEYNKFELHGLYVEPTFINYAAQTRVHDTMRDAFGDIPMGSNLFDPRRGAYGLIIGDTTINNPYESRYNDIIFATNQGRNGGLVLNSAGIQPGGIYLTHGYREQSLPMGLATPNRSGYGAKYSGKWFDGMIQPDFFGGMYKEIFPAYNVPAMTDVRVYTKAGGQIKIDLTSFGIPMNIRGGAVYEDTHSNTFVAFTTMTIDYEINWEMFKKVHLNLGFEHIDMNGADFFDYGNPLDPLWVYVNNSRDVYAAGLEWKISKSTNMYVTYAYQDVYRNSNYGAGYSGPIYDFNYGAQEYEAKLVTRF